MTWQDINEIQKKEANFNFDYGPLLDEIYAKLPDAPVVVELGTFLGCAAAYLATQHPEQTEKGKLYTVDLFDQYAFVQNFFMQAAKNLHACGVRDKVHMLACRSWEAAQLFEDKEVNFLWIDAGHTFLAVKADLEAWAPKIKPGGFLAGHDLSEPSVKQAVEQFCFQTKKEYNVWNPTGWQSWWIQV